MPSSRHRVLIRFPAKDGQRTLSALDEYRYVEAPASFAAGKSGKGMSLEDVKLLVEWKL